MKNRTYESVLPEGYTRVRRLDINDKKLNIKISIGAILLMLAILLPLMILHKKLYHSLEFHYVWMLIIMCASLLLHELIHGIVYYALTRQKLTFGISLNSLYCGLPEVYTYRKTSLLSMLAPFVLFTIIFTTVIIIVPDPEWKLTIVFDLAVHTSGCIGDLYEAGLFFFRYKDPSVLLKDTGPVQEYYARK